jgi:glycosyltransferase involved in cell wall biosynthesis
MIEEDDDGVAESFPLSENVKRALSTRFSDPDIDLLIVRPERFAYYGKARFRTGYMVYEADRWPKAWIGFGKAHLDLVLTPSNFCRDGMVASGMPADRVAVLPHGVDPGCFRQSPSAADDRTFRILFVGTPSRRKGLALLLDALPLVRTGEASLRLTIKTEHWPERSDGEDDLLAKLDAVRSRGIDVVIDRNCLPEAEMATLYRSHDVTCLPHMGEGFGLCALEAMACGCPVIATAWSGPADFLDVETGWPILEFDEIRTGLPLPKSFPSPCHARMVTPRTTAIARQLEQCMNAGAFERRRRGKLASARAATYDWNAIARQYLELIPRIPKNQRL